LSNATNNNFIWSSNANIGINNSNPLFTLDINGNIKGTTLNLINIGSNINIGNSNNYTITTSNIYGTNSNVILSMVQENCVGNTTAVSPTVYSQKLIIKGSTFNGQLWNLTSLLQAPFLYGGAVELQGGDSFSLGNNGSAYAKTFGGDVILTPGLGNSNNLIQGTVGNIIFNTYSNLTTTKQEVMRVHNNGFVGISTSNPTQILDMANGPIQLRYGNNNISTLSNQILLSYANTTTYTHCINSRHNAGGGGCYAVEFLLWDSNVYSTTKGTTVALSVPVIYYFLKHFLQEIQLFMHLIQQ
jgi:hypothetical protein